MLSYIVAMLLRVTSHTISHSLALVLLVQISVEDEIWTPPEDIHILCPYTSFCNKNATETFPLSGGSIPCCRPCSCSEQCGLYDNCCLWTLDKYRTQEKFQMMCRSQEALQGQNTHLSYYKMINKCLSRSNELDNQISCEQNTSNPLLTFHSVYSPSFGMTYINLDCAGCNNVTDGIKWQKVVTCANDIDEVNFEDVEKLIQGENTDFQDGCSLYYIPPEGFDLTNAKCEPNVIRTCNTTQLAKTEDESLNRCSEFNATFIYSYHGKPMRYGNVYCWMCNTDGANGLKQDMCPVRYFGSDGRNPMMGSSLTIIIDMTNKQVQDKRPANKLCRPSEVFLRSFKWSCRPRRCPFGQILFEEKCGFYSKEWNGGPFYVLLKLTPTTVDTIPISFFNGMPTSFLRNSSAQWLRRGALQDWFVLPAIQTTDNRTSVRQLLIKLTYSNDSADPSYLQRAINQALCETWSLNHGTENFPLNVSLNDVKKYFYNKIFYDLSGLQTEATALIASHILYLQQLDQLDERDLLFPLYPFQYIQEFSYGFILTKLFLCQQVDLLPDEYYFSFVKIHFKVTNKTLYDAEFRSVPTEKDVDNSTTQKWTVRVCIDEFPIEIKSSNDSTCLTNIFLTTIILYSVLQVI